MHPHGLDGPQRGIDKETEMAEKITIEEAEYDRLIDSLQEAEDNAAVNAHLAAPAVGMPGDLVRRLNEGESPLAIHREWRGLSATELARRSKINRVQIRNIEAGRKKGAAATMKKLADALDVRTDDLT